MRIKQIEYVWTISSEEAINNNPPTVTYLNYTFLSRVKYSLNNVQCELLRRVEVTFGSPTTPM